MNEFQQAKLWDLTKIITDVVSAINFIRSRGTNHRQFKALFDELENEYVETVLL
jgi:hypothetical protein